MCENAKWKSVDVKFFLISNRIEKNGLRSSGTNDKLSGSAGTGLLASSLCSIVVLSDTQLYKNSFETPCSDAKLMYLAFNVNGSNTSTIGLALLSV